MSLRFCVLAPLLFAIPAAVSAATLSGSVEELAAHFEKKVETVHLSATSVARLKPARANVRGTIEAEGKSFLEAQQLASRRSTALMAALKDHSVELAATVADPDTALELQKLKKVVVRTEFLVALKEPALAELVLMAAAGVEGVSVSDIEAIYEPDAELGLRLLKSALADLERQRALYEEAFGLELRVQSFLPFGQKETGGGDDSEELVQLSPFVVSTSGRYRRLQKSRPDDAIIQKQFLSREVSKTVSAVYEIVRREKP